jgi:hypothetical protein
MGRRFGCGPKGWDRSSSSMISRASILSYISCRFETMPSVSVKFLWILDTSASRSKPSTRVRGSSFNLSTFTSCSRISWIDTRESTRAFKPYLVDVRLSFEDCRSLDSSDTSSDLILRRRDASLARSSAVRSVSASVDTAECAIRYQSAKIMIVGVQPAKSFGSPTSFALCVDIKSKGWT